MLLVVGVEIVRTASTFQVKIYIGVSSYFQVILSRSSVRSFSTHLKFFLTTSNGKAVEPPIIYRVLDL